MTQLLHRLRVSLTSLEDRTFDLFHRIELSWRHRPADGYHSPSPFERRVLRTVVGATLTLFALLFVSNRSLRIKLLVILLIVLFLAFVILSLLDAFPRGKRRPPNTRK